MQLNVKGLIMKTLANNVVITLLKLQINSNVRHHP